MNIRIYRGYKIQACPDGTFDVLEFNNELIDGNFHSNDEAKHLIDEILGVDRETA